MKRTLVTLASVLAFALVSHGAVVTVNWEGINTPLKGADNSTLLTAGSAANGDGAILELGYYSAATTADNFAGTWIALTGPASANTSFAATTIGDMDGGEEALGIFSLQTVFDTLVSTKSQNLPSVGVPLTIRFYNSTSLGTATHYGAVSNDAWLWQAPAELVEAPVITMTVDSTTSGLTWQGGGPGFFTNQAIPEPTVALLSMVGGSAMLLMRRRRS